MQSLFLRAYLLLQYTCLPDVIMYAQHYPDFTKGLLLLGDVAMNHMRNLSLAEESFRRAIATEPESVQANHNLCVVLVEYGRLVEAERCLVHAEKLGPNEQYIKNHLGIVRSRLQQLEQHQQQQQLPKTQQKVV